MIGINRFPDGLLALLDLKSRGNTPAILADTVSPTIDMLGFYELGETLGWSQNAGTLSSGNTVAPVTVPAGEVWLVRQAALKIQALGAGQVAAYLTGGPANTIGQTEPLVAMGPATGVYNFSATGLAASCILTWQPQWPLLMRSGWVFAAFTDTLTGGGFTASVSVLRTVYRT